jgi:hypothetical protein
MSHHHYPGPDLKFPNGDARLNFADLYAFPKAGDGSKSILIMNVHPSYGFSMKTQLAGYLPLSQARAFARPAARTRRIAISLGCILGG